MHSFPSRVEKYFSLCEGSLPTDIALEIINNYIITYVSYLSYEHIIKDSIDIGIVSRLLDQ